LHLTGTAEVIWDGDEMVLRVQAAATTLLSLGWVSRGVVFPCWSAPDFRPFSIALAGYWQTRLTDSTMTTYMETKPPLHHSL